MATSTLPIEVSVSEVKQLQDAGQAIVLVDCREAEEIELASLDGACWAPMSRWDERVGAFAGQQAQRIIVYCHHGVRSRWAATWLRQRGFDQAQSMAGGIDRWALEVAPGMARY